MTRPMVIAIDGPAASGKGTLARRLAAHFAFAYLDTGRIYRAVGYKILCCGGDPDDPETALKSAQSLCPADLTHDALSSHAVSDAASRVAAQEDVRRVLLDFQRGFAATPPDGAAGAVLDGRDIAAVICPDADVKLFVTAEAEIRARRRYKELRDRGEERIYARVLEDVQQRDARDRNRSAAPLRVAEGAVVLDTTHLDADEAFQAALAIAAPVIARKP